MTVLFVCYGDPEECQCCGGWIHAGDPPEVPVGEPAIDGKYCSTDCHDSMTAFIAERVRAENALVTERALADDLAADLKLYESMYGTRSPALALYREARQP